MNIGPVLLFTMRHLQTHKKHSFERLENSTECCGWEGQQLEQSYVAVETKIWVQANISQDRTGRRSQIERDYRDGTNRWYHFYFQYICIFKLVFKYNSWEDKYTCYIHYCLSSIETPSYNHLLFLLFYQVLVHIFWLCIVVYWGTYTFRLSFCITHIFTPLSLRNTSISSNIHIS